MDRSKLSREQKLHSASGLAASVMAALRPRPVTLEAIGGPLTIPHNYGQPEQHEVTLGLTPRYSRTADRFSGGIKAGDRKRGRATCSASLLWEGAGNEVYAFT